MLQITEYEIELIKDPFGIIPGKRYECKLEIEVPEDDELYSEKGIYIRVIFGVDENKSGIVKYDIHERATDRYIDLDLEDEESAQLEAFCKEHLNEAEE